MKSDFPPQVKTLSEHFLFQKFQVLSGNMHENKLAVTEKKIY